MCTMFRGCFFFKQKTAYEMRISDWSSDVCSSDLGISAFIVAAAITMIVNRIGTRTVSGSADARNTHGSARWAKKSDVRRAALMGSVGVVVGGWKGSIRVKVLRHDGPEHVMDRSAERRVGKECVRPCRSRWSHDH